MEGNEPFYLRMLTLEAACLRNDCSVLAYNSYSGRLVLRGSQSSASIQPQVEDLGRDTAIHSLCGSICLT
jgi:hypothetical protein